MAAARYVSRVSTSAARRACVLVAVARLNVHQVRVRRRRRVRVRVRVVAHTTRVVVDLYYGAHEPLVGRDHDVDARAHRQRVQSRRRRRRRPARRRRRRRRHRARRRGAAAAAAAASACAPPCPSTIRARPSTPRRAPLAWGCRNASAARRRRRRGPARDQGPGPRPLRPPPPPRRRRRAGTVMTSTCGVAAASIWSRQRSDPGREGRRRAARGGH